MSPLPTAQTFANRALEAVDGPRNEQYGPPHINHANTARLWNAYLEAKGWDPITAEDVCFLNILQKIARSSHAITDDSIVDVIGYALNVAVIREER